jgi:large subunit ribosomal protein L5
MARLLEKYRNEVRPALMQRFGLKNVMAAPRLDKIIISMGLGKSIIDKTVVESAVRDLTLIAGQKPVLRKARVSISAFKVREGMVVGAIVTLRGLRMYEFLDRFINVAVPRIRDFRGLPRGFDGRGNFNMGLNEQSVFPEVQVDKIEHSQGMNLAFVVRNSNDERTEEMLKGLGMPFARLDQDERPGHKN